MGINDDFVNPLVTDILTEVAGNFFEARRLLDHKIELFHNNVELLKQSAGVVDARAAFLNYLLIDETEAAALYESLPLPAKPFLVGEKLSDLARPSSLPAALTVRRKYFKLVFWAFDKLRRACDTYLNGERRHVNAQRQQEETVKVYFHMLDKMHTLINEDIEKINCYLSPSCTLQYARTFDMQTSEKEKTFGKISPDLSSLDEKLRYKPIDFGSLNLKTFPDLPSGAAVKTAIKATVKRVYCNQRSRVKERLAALR